MYSLITVLGLGSVLHPVLAWADVKNKPKLPTEQIALTNNCNNSIKKALSLFDTDYFAPLFIRETSHIEDRNEGRSESFAVTDTMAAEIRERKELLHDIDPSSYEKAQQKSSGSDDNVDTQGIEVEK